MPMSIYDEAGLRKNTKSSLYCLFHKHDELKISDCVLVIDGGRLLHKVPWTSKKSFSYIMFTYVTYLRANYGKNVTIVFDGYDRQTTKSSERNRRCAKKGCLEYDFQKDMLLEIPQELFLSSSKNKSRFIGMLIEVLEENSFKCKQANDDADTLIVTTAIEKTEIATNNSKVAILAEDVDVLVILAALTPGDREIFYIKPPKCKTPGATYSSKSLDHSPIIKENILFLHAMSGCDTTSAFYGKGKTKLGDVLKKSVELQDAAKIFKQPYASLDELVTSGIKCILALYGSKRYDVKLNQFRFDNFSKSVASKKTRVLLCSLPPTEDAALQHIKKVYLQIQYWMGNLLDPTNWGWELDVKRNLFKPIPMTNEVAPSFC